MGKRIVVRNLGSLVSSSDLEEMFSTVGEVESADVKTTEVRGNVYNIGYVQMSDDQQAIDSIQRFNGQKMDGLVLVVTEDIPHVPNPNFMQKKPSTSGRSKAKA